MKWSDPPQHFEVCANGCGATLVQKPIGRPRKFCSERCRTNYHNKTRRHGVWVQLEHERDLLARALGDLLFAAGITNGQPLTIIQLLVAADAARDTFDQQRTEQP